MSLSVIYILLLSPEENRRKLVPQEGLVEPGDSLENAPVVDSDSEIDSDMDNEQLEWESEWS